MTKAKTTTEYTTERNQRSPKKLFVSDVNYECSESSIFHNRPSTEMPAVHF